MSYRASYWKTTALFITTAVAFLAALAIAPLSALPFMPAVVIRGILIAGLVASVLFAAGGVVCLWRDHREASGKADLLADLAVRKANPGRLSRHITQLLFGSRLRPGDLVRVRSIDEIRKTLDRSGTLDGLPFMLEMEHFSERTFRVHRRVDHINDMRSKTGLRRIRNVVTLTDVRCTGSHHGECEAECQILWKDTWLERPGPQHAAGEFDRGQRNFAVHVDHPANAPADKVYFCQMTALWEASEPMSPFDFRQDLRPVLSGNIGIRDYIAVLLTQLFNLAQHLRGGIDYPYWPGQSTKREQAPSGDLDLKVGEKVLVRTKEEIAATLNNGRNRGLWFDRDMIRFCGRPAMVRKRVSRVIHEGTGRMAVMKTSCLMLENVIATGEFLRLCPQHEYIFWREAWLRRPNSCEADALRSGCKEQE